MKTLLMVVLFCVSGCGDGEGNDRNNTIIDIACSNIIIRTEGTVDCGSNKEGGNCEQCLDEEFREDVSTNERPISFESCLDLLTAEGKC